MQACLIIQKYFRHSLLFKFNLNFADIRKHTCSICLEDGYDMVYFPCKHTFHPSCILKWLLDKKKTCPCCRSTAVPPKPRCCLKIVDIPVDILIGNHNNIVSLRDIYENCGNCIVCHGMMGDKITIPCIRKLLLEYHIAHRYETVQNNSIEIRRFLNGLIS